MNVLCAILTRDTALQDEVKDAVTSAMQQAEAQGIECRYTRCIERYGVAIGRNRVVATFLASDCTHLLFIDDDVCIPPDTITRLVEADADIAGGCYVFLAEQGRRIVPSIAVRVDGDWVRQWFDGVIEADRVATGCMLIQRDVFGRVGNPGAWFQWPSWLNEDGHFESTSDDVDFCRRAKDAGCRIVAHGNVRCGHFRRIDLGALVPGRAQQPVEA